MREDRDLLAAKTWCPASRARGEADVLRPEPLATAAATELALALGRGEVTPQVGLELTTTLTVRESTSRPANQ